MSKMSFAIITMVWRHRVSICGESNPTHLLQEGRQRGAWPKWNLKVGPI